MNKLDNLNSWKIFLSLANTRNFQVTADYFESDLSTITRNLDTLEKALGQKLVFRKTRPLELTEFGKKSPAADESASQETSANYFGAGIS